MNRYSAVSTFSEAKYLLNEKTRRLNPFYDQLETAFEEKLSLKKIGEIQNMVFAHHHDMVALRNSFDAIKSSDKLCVIDDWNTARRQCVNHINELRYYEGKLTTERKEIIQEKLQRRGALAAVLSYAFLFPGAAGSTINLIHGIDDKIPPLVAFSVALIGLSYHFTKESNEIEAASNENIPSSIKVSLPERKKGNVKLITEANYRQQLRP